MSTVLLLERVRLQERRRCVGLNQRRRSEHRERLAGRRDLADVLDAVVTQIEQTEPVPEMAGAEFAYVGSLPAGDR